MGWKNNSGIGCDVHCVEKTRVVRYLRVLLHVVPCMEERITSLHDYAGRHHVCQLECAKENIYRFDDGADARADNQFKHLFYSENV